VSPTGQPNKEVTTLRKRVQDLSEENNMLKFKVEALLDMVSLRAYINYLALLFTPDHVSTITPHARKLAVSKADFQTLERQLEATAQPVQSTPRR
jgi:hypothetical protein